MTESAPIPSEKSSIGESFLPLPILLWSICGALSPFQNDTWWHLRTGEVIWETGKVPLSDIYSWVLPANTPWPNHEWLFQLMLYLAYRLGGFPLVNFLAGCLIGFSAWFLAQAMRGSAKARALTLLIPLPWLIQGMAIRPHLCTIFFLSLLLYLISKERLRLIPFIILLWAQFHAGVMLGLAVLVISSSVLWLFDKARAQKFSLAAIFSAVLGLINPLGFGLYSYPFKAVPESESLPLIEWQPPGFHDIWQLYFWIIAFSFLILVLIKRPRAKDWSAIVFGFIGLALLPLAVRHVREIYIWLPIAGVSMSYLCFEPQSPRLPQRINSRYIAAAWILAFVAITWLWFNPKPFLKWQPLSKTGLQVLASLKEPIFNSYDTGSLLIWFAPNKKVFIDSRQNPYPTKLLREVIELQKNGDFENFFKEFGFRSAVIEPWMPLAASLENAGWIKRYSGQGFEVLEAPDNPS